MSNYNSLKTTIDANIKQNGNQEITGQILNSVLNAMVTTLGAGYQFAGVATIDTNPGTPDAKVFYIANGKGKYEKFGGINVTEDDVVVLYWDSSWHKVSTGIASQAKLSELEGKVNGKQDALTLTVKDNGNIVIANIQGQTKEFMPATPSGDPMHYAYEAVGAFWNGTGKDIVRRPPWADLADDDADKTVMHKAGYWYLYGLGDIDNAEMTYIYRYGIIRDSSFSGRFVSFPRRAASILLNSAYFLVNIRSLAYSAQNLVSLETKSSINIEDLPYAFYNCRNLIYIGGMRVDKAIPYLNTFYQCDSLKFIKLDQIASSWNFQYSPNLTSKSILYMIKNESATSAITITLHADAYARAMANTDIVAALEAHPNVSLASA